MSKQRTEVVLLLDVSGSMYSLTEETIGSVESFIKSQKELDAGIMRLSIIEFNDKVLPILARRKIKNVPAEYPNYKPRGWTALLDAIGYAIKNTEDMIGTLSDKLAPDKVIVVILTDGYENSSKEYSASDIRSLITEKQKNDWDFLYLGANQDAFQVSGNLGINANTVTNFDSTQKGTPMAYAAASSYVAEARSGGDVSENWRDKLIDED